MNVSFGVEFDDDIICAVDKLEQDHVLKEVNPCAAATETAPCHRKEKYSRRKPATHPPGSSHRKTLSSDLDSDRMKSRPSEDAMSLTVVKGHGSEKLITSTHTDGNDQDIVCTWNSPLLVSTPVVVGSKRRVVNGSIAKRNVTGDAATVTGHEVTTPKLPISDRKCKSKKPENTKLFDAILDNSLNAVSLGCSRGPDNGHETAATSPVSNANGKLWHLPVHYMLLPLLQVGMHRIHDFQIRPYPDPEPMNLAGFGSQPDLVNLDSYLVWNWRFLLRLSVIDYTAWLIVFSLVLC